MSTRLRVARHSRYFWWIAGGAAVLALALVFVLGFLTGRPGNAAAPAASPAVATKAAVPTTKAPTEATQAPTQATQNNSQQNDQNQNQNAGVPVASRAGQDVWMFRPAKDGRDFFPLELCQPKSDTSWTCTPTASDGDSIVAMAVPRNSSLDLADKAKNGGKTEPQNDWSQTTQVK